MRNDLLEQLLDKTDTLIKLQAANAVKDLETQRGKIEFLSSCGMQPRDIATVLNTTSNSVSVALSKIRKAQAKEK